LYAREIITDLLANFAGRIVEKISKDLPGAVTHLVPNNNPTPPATRPTSPPHPRTQSL